MTNDINQNIACKINGLDALATYGVVFPDTSLNQLMNFAPLKSYVTNTGANIDGVQVLSVGAYAPHVDKQDYTLVFYLYANSLSTFNTRRDALEAVLRAGAFTLWVKERPNDLYRLLYNKCTQFTQYNGRLAKFTLKCEEPNPNNRTIPVVVEPQNNSTQND